MKSSPLWKSISCLLSQVRQGKGKAAEEVPPVNSPHLPASSGFLVFITHPTMLPPFPTHFSYSVRQEVSMFPLSQVCPWRFSRGQGFPCLMVTGCPGDAPDRPCRWSGVVPPRRARHSPASRELCMGKSFIFLLLPRHVLSLNFYVCNPS